MPIQKKNTPPMSENEHPDIPSDTANNSGINKRTRLMLEAMPFPCHLQKPDLKILYCNRADLDLFQMEDESVFSDNFYTFSPDYQIDGTPTIEAASGYIREALETGKCTFEWTHQTLDGTLIPCEVTLVRVIYEDEYAIAGYVRDLREHKKMIAQLKTALADAETANHAKSDFLAGISHEMRTPLNAIIGLSEIILDTGSLNTENQSNLEKIYNSGVSLLSLINDLLDITKVQAGKFVILENQYDIPSLINDAILQNVLRIGSKPIRLILNIDESMPACLYGDELRIRQIINNLLSNAIKYTEKGKVELGLRCERDGDAVWLTVYVSDTGIGIRPEHLARLFTNYTQFGLTSKHQAGGTGLGLAITKSLVEMMKGTVTVESKYGEGSTFTARILQRYMNDTVIGPEVVANLKRFRYSASKLNRNSRLNRIRLPYAHVLVVDDNITNLDVARGFMKPYEIRVDCVTCGKDAIRAIREGKVKYNAVFMDHMMPEMDGVEATRLIREEIGTEYARKVPIIALTANAIAGNEEMFLKNGFQGFVSKPINLARLDEVIRRFVRDKEQEVLPEEQISDRWQIVLPEGQISDGEREKTFAQSPDLIDITQGLELYGDEASFLRILRSYAVNTKPVLASIKDVDPRMLADYTITVHGLKGASRNICAEPVGAQAEALEYAARAGNFDFISQNNPVFVETVQKLIGNIESMLARIAKSHPKPQKEKPDTGDLSRLLDACEGFDFDEIDLIMEKIERYEYTDDNGLSTWLRENITQMNFAQITEKLNQTCRSNSE